MRPLHINVTRASVAAAIGAAASALFPLASPLHTLVGVNPEKTQAVSVILGAVAALLAGAGHSVFTPDPPPENPTIPPGKASP